MTEAHVDLRISEEMKEVTNINQARELSIHTDFNFFWKFDNFNIYEVTISD